MILLRNGVIEIRFEGRQDIPGVSRRLRVEGDAALGGLVDVYDHGGYLEERRKALGLLAAFLVRCEQPADKVISLRKAG